jgi:hypothetical protein
MQKSISFPAFLTAVIATGLFAIPTKALPSQEQRVSVADAANLNDRVWLDTVRENSSTDNINRIIGITGLSIGGGFIAYRLYRHDKASVTNLANGKTNTLLLDRLSPKLRKKLLQLIHNRETANRLLTGTMLTHADRSPNWLAEKVIYDLERDRL